MEHRQSKACTKYENKHMLYIKLLLQIMQLLTTKKCKVHVTCSLLNEWLMLRVSFYCINLIQIRLFQSCAYDKSQLLRASSY